MTQKQEDMLERARRLNVKAHNLAIKVLKGEVHLALQMQAAEAEADTAWDAAIAELEHDVCACGANLGSILEVLDGRCTGCEPRQSEAHHFTGGR